MTNYRCLILDLDGTVVNSHDYTFAAIRHACAPFGVRPDDASIHAAFGPDEGVILRRLVGANNVEVAYARLQHYYAEHVHALEVQAEVRTLLHDCQVQGVRRGLFTGRGSDSTRLILERLDLVACFDAIVAGDHAPPKPAANGVLALLQRLRCAPREALLVGDSPLDLRAASAAGTDARLATWFMSDVTRSGVEAPTLSSPGELRALLGLPRPV
ncbi:MAG: HAD-IA family hydrolase [Candidatus Latescibacterota bacterium]|nr:MAG: HAD-IA family hydrolase [Candidatus Latescibacterota bacterium]